ncbi:hypothetical protein E8E11_010661 [Didymella keratinophila]|nr:hypothetical protein E8E11_010661 [Didymella keratinophila]
MVTTRRQSKTIDPPALPPVAPPKRKRSDDATPAQSAAQAPNQPSTKRRKKVRSTAKVDSLAAAPAGPVKASEPKKKVLSKTAERKARKQKAQATATAQSGGVGTAPSNSQRSTPLDLTNDDSSEDEAPRPPRPAALRDADDEGADSRYTIGSKRKGKAKKTAAATAPWTAELQFEEDGVEEVDKAQVAVADASNRTFALKKKPGPVGGTPINPPEGSAATKDKVDTPQAGAKAADKTKEKPSQLSAQGKSKNKPVQRKVPPAGVPSKVVMFTIAEAIAALSLYKNGTMSMAAEIDPESRQPYAPLQTGEYLSYPVKSNYHLGALGRYGIDAAAVPPFSLTIPLSEHSFIESSTVTSTAASSRHGLGFTALPAQPKTSSVRRANNYCFTFGRYRGRRVDSVPITYLRSIFEGDEYYADTKLQQSFADLYPKGLYESETESFVFEKGGFKGKRLDEVPKSYVWGLIRKKGEGVDVGGKKQRKALERALEVWEKRQLDLTKD